MKINRLLAGTMVLILISGIGTPAFAQLSITSESTTAEPNRPLTDEDDVIFDGGTSDFNSAFVLDAPTIVLLAEDFELTEATKLRDVHFDVLQLDDFLAEFTYAVYEDDGGLPGTLIQAGQGINEHKVPIPNAPDSFRYWFDLDTPIPLDANTRYWIQLLIINSPSTFLNGWWSTTPGFGNGFAFSIDGGVTWFPQNGQLNLVLTGGDDVVGGEIIPIESTTLLLAGIQTTAIWMFPVIAGAAGATAFYLKSRKN